MSELISAAIVAAAQLLRAARAAGATDAEIEQAFVEMNVKVDKAIAELDKAIARGNAKDK